MNVALVKDGIVINIAYFEDDAPESQSIGILRGDKQIQTIPIPPNMNAAIGDTFRDNAFYAPDGQRRIVVEPEPEPEPNVPIDTSAFMKDAVTFVPASKAEEAKATVADIADRLEALQILFGEGE